jgi:Protein of unknown function (DUF3037)
MTRMSAMYTIIRYIPNILKEEFVNVGVILVCPEVGFQRLRAIPSFGEGSKAKLLEGSDGLFVRHAVSKLEELLELNRAADLVGEEGVTNKRLNFTGLATLQKMYNNNIQLSQPFSAATDNPEALLEKLYRDFVDTVEVKPKSERVTSGVIRRKVERTFAELELFDAGLQKNWKLPVKTHIVDMAYKNGVWHCYQAISFATTHKGTISDVIKDTNSYRQAASDAKNSSDPNIENAHFTVLGYLPPSPSSIVEGLVQDLKDNGIKWADYEEAPEIAKDIARDIKAHQPSLNLAN